MVFPLNTGATCIGVKFLITSSAKVDTEFRAVAGFKSTQTKKRLKSMKRKAIIYV